MATGAAELPPVELTWRTEVKERGKYWNWRKGSRKHRQYQHGGTFDGLPLERRIEYERNRQRQAR